jgi:hypothetical protein
MASRHPEQNELQSVTKCSPGGIEQRFDSPTKRSTVPDGVVWSRMTGCDKRTMLSGAPGMNDAAQLEQAADKRVAGSAHGATRGAHRPEPIRSGVATKTNRP